MVSVAELPRGEVAELRGGELPHMRAHTHVHMRESHGGWTVGTWQLGDFASELTAKILAQKD